MEVEADVGTEQISEAVAEPLFGTVDIILLLALIGVGGWWLLKSRTKPDIPTANGKSYSIQ